MVPIINEMRLSLPVIIGLFLVLFMVSGCDSPEEVVPAPEEEEAVDPVEEEAVDPVEEEADAPEEVAFTMDEIARYDGKDGNPAYIVVDGVVYDVTDVGPWGSGSHFGFEAGADVTEALEDAAPHGANMLNQAEVVGKIGE